jgi:iron complex outermembrane receptor protein
MNTRTFLFVLASLVTLALTGHAQTSPANSSTGPARTLPDQAANGRIEGRVQNAATGEFVQGARLSVVGTSHVTFTDSDGSYRLSNLPAGEAIVEAFYTGQPPQTMRVTVPPGGVAQQDVTFSTGSPKEVEAAIKLDAFVVSTSREMSGASLAINEQRFAPNLRTILSSDEFGTIAEANTGEFMKFMPGVNIEIAGGNARGVSLNGVPGPYVPITYGGFALASATGSGNGGTSRQVALDTVSINNLSRVEVTFSPTPESPGSALAGTVNFVPRSSFERAKPVFNFSANITMREYARDWGRTPAPFGDNRKVHPGADFSYIAPVNKRLGFTLAGGVSKVYSAEPQITLTWRGAQTATNGTAFPNTTVDQPYLTSVAVKNSQKQSDRTSFSGSVDYKLSPHDRITVSMMTSTFDVQTDNSVLTTAITGVAPGNFQPTSIQGSAGAGTLTLGRSGATRTNLTYMPSVLWRHDGPVWKNEAGFAYSHSSNRSRNGGPGVGEYFGGNNTTRTGVTIGFADIASLGPRSITVADAAGKPINPYTIDNFIINTASRDVRATDDIQQTAYAKTRRDFYGAIPLSLTTGLDVRRGIRDQRASTPSFTYLGTDGQPGTTAIPGSDNTATPFIDSSFSRYSGPYFPNRFDALSADKLYAHYVANPTQFRADDNASYRSEVTNSKRAQELVSAAYLRADLSFFSNRLKIVGGVRAEQTNIDAEGPLSDPTRNILRDSSGRPILLNGRTQPITTDALAASKLTFLDRGAKSKKEYLRLFPSMNASYSIRENLIVRAAYATSIGRPDYNQYAGGVTLPDPANPLPTDVITVSNVAIKPWSARSFTARIEYYLPGVG